MSWRKLVSCLVLEVMCGGESCGVDIVVLSEFEEGEDRFVTLDPGVDRLDRWRVLVLFSRAFLGDLYRISSVVLF